MWLDCRAYGISSEALGEHLKKKHNLVLSTGTIYGDAGEGFMRLNIACPRSTLLEGLSRLRDGLEEIGRRGAK
jgi:cystathionine beta-lyase